MGLSNNTLPKNSDRSSDRPIPCEQQLLPIKDPIDVKISCSQKETTSSVPSCSCKFCFTNNTSQELYLLNDYTPLEGMRSHFLIVSLNTIGIIPYQGVLVKRLPPKRENFTCLKPNEIVSSPEIDMTESYNLSHAGMCTVKYSRPLFYLTKEEMKSFEADQFRLGSLNKSSGSASTEFMLRKRMPRGFSAAKCAEVPLKANNNDDDTSYFGRVNWPTNILDTLILCDGF